ncbi:unnamed protein product [Spirodela intermedia]|uniref:Protein OS9-like domain-containing protein n=1 Tax=Spirodela intermedia TaxID=51605 RepID=A0A7I8JKZ9_SPIIN|nr:unnamed protein product [Spirodela intermedia]CAA6670445.1 unnamed protein product [Spirodela intermedia]
MEKMPAMGNRHRRTAGGLRCSPLVVFLSLYSHFLVFSGAVSARLVLESTSDMIRLSDQLSGLDIFILGMHNSAAGSGQESIVMSKKDGQQYLCYLPLIEEIKSPVVGSDKRTKLKKPDEYMEHEGWWIYEFCHEKSIRQFHTNHDKIIQEFSLGVFDPEATDAFNQNFSGIIASVKDPRYKDGSQSSISILLLLLLLLLLLVLLLLLSLLLSLLLLFLGEICLWEHGVVLTSIKEVATCKYEVTVQCPLICRHPMFHLERPALHAIHCNEIPKTRRRWMWRTLTSNRSP